MKTIVSDHKLNALAENYRAAQTSKSFSTYVALTQQSDPGFFGWLFDDDSIDDYGAKASDEQLEAWHDLMIVLSSHENSENMFDRDAILDAMKKLIRDGESLTTAAYTGYNSSAFQEFADVNGFDLETTVSVYDENEAELERIWQAREFGRDCSRRRVLNSI